MLELKCYNATLKLNMYEHEVIVKLWAQQKVLIEQNKILLLRCIKLDKDHKIMVRYLKKIKKWGCFHELNYSPPA